jgi:hypothetical protein
VWIGVIEGRGGKRWQKKDGDNGSRRKLHSEVAEGRRR